MEVRELIELLEQYDEDAEVRVALQPSWPLRASVQNVICSEELRNLDGEGGPLDPDADLEEAFVWIAVDQVSSSSENPYAPRAAWSES